VSRSSQPLHRVFKRFCIPLHFQSIFLPVSCVKGVFCSRSDAVPRRSPEAEKLLSADINFSGNPQSPGGNLCRFCLHGVSEIFDVARFLFQPTGLRPDFRDLPSSFFSESVGDPVFFPPDLVAFSKRDPFFASDRQIKNQCRAPSSFLICPLVLPT